MTSWIYNPANKQTNTDEKIISLVEVNNNNNKISAACFGQLCYSRLCLYAHDYDAEVRKQKKMFVCLFGV